MHKKEDVDKIKVDEIREKIKAVYTELWTDDSSEDREDQVRDFHRWWGEVMEDGEVIAASRLLLAVSLYEDIDFEHLLLTVQCMSPEERYSFRVVLSHLNKSYGWKYLSRILSDIPDFDSK